MREMTFIPVSVNDIITDTDVKRWPYLSKMHIPNITAHADLLVGTNAPKILEPWEVVNSCENGPYAIRTVLGWVINGPLTENSSSRGKELQDVVVNRISVS